MDIKTIKFMGNSCSCESNEKISEIVAIEFSNKPIQKTLIGSSANDENFISLNEILHNNSFTQNFFNQKSNDRSKSITTFSKKSKKTSESFQISLFRSVQEYSKGEDDSNSIILEGELLKYRPGINREYTSRWCRLTYDGFAYYKNQ